MTMPLPRRSATDHRGPLRRFWKDASPELNRDRTDAPNSTSCFCEACRERALASSRSDPASLRDATRDESCRKKNPRSQTVWFKRETWVYNWWQQSIPVRVTIAVNIFVEQTDNERSDHTFRIAITDDQLEDLKRRLRETRWPERECVDDWTQGLPSRTRRRSLHIGWRSTTGVRARPCSIAFRNSRHKSTAWESTLSMSARRIQTRRHPYHARMAGVDCRVSKGNRTAHQPDCDGGEAADAFHVVCPSLPGYGFSDKPTRTGWNVQRIAKAWSELMLRLGYKRYAAQGGDWGAAVTTCIGFQDPANCLGIHVNLPLVLPCWCRTDPSNNDLTAKEKSAIAGIQYYNDWDSGYSKEQSTRPQTVGYGLTDSPAGQMTWILEKFWAWTDCGGHPENVLTRDELLDNVMIYWLPERRLVGATLLGEFPLDSDDAVRIPAGCSIFPKEIFRSSRRWAEKRYRNWSTSTSSPRAGTSPHSSSPKRSCARCAPLPTDQTDREIERARRPRVAHAWSKSERIRTMALERYPMLWKLYN